MANKKQEFKLGGFFKKNKECAFSFKLFLVDKIFAYGSGLPKRPIKLGVYDKNISQWYSTKELEKIDEKKVPYLIHMLMEKNFI